jgi:alpha-beta hydrolase superfamily lysophospholipase
MFIFVCPEKKEFKDLPFFLMGESMGGAVALKTQFRKPETWDGAVLIAPMCKVSIRMKTRFPLTVNVLF